MRFRGGVQGAIRRAPVPFEVRSRLAWWADLKFRRPTTFNELVRRRMALERRPIFRTFVDKVAVREYVARKVGPDVLPICYAIVDDPRSIDREALPREFAIKPSYGSGATLLVTDQAPLDAPQPQPRIGWGRHLVHPDVLDWEALVRTAAGWLRRGFGKKTLEWAYLRVPRRIIVEELLGSGVPDDIKFLVFDGVPRFVTVDTGRFGDHRRDCFTPAWEPLDLDMTFPRSGRVIPRPTSLEAMLEVSARLADGLDFIRVDLYDIDGRVVFGELTVYPAAGHEVFSPAAFDNELGRWWTPRQ